MPRNRFYKVEKTAFLFPAQSHPESERENPEEPVRHRLNGNPHRVSGESPLKIWPDLFLTFRS
jgi:hypothetical protein